GGRGAGGRQVGCEGTHQSSCPRPFPWRVAPGPGTVIRTNSHCSEVDHASSCELVGVLLPPVRGRLRVETRNISARNATSPASPYEVRAQDHGGTAAANRPEVPGQS